MSKSDEDSDDEVYFANMPDFGDHVDNGIFSQILEMDESDHDRDFSEPLVSNFFEQAEDTFEKMDRALAARDLNELSTLGHFLKGSSATLGFNRIRDSCQVVQQYGHKLTVDGASEPDEDVCLKKIAEALQTAKVDTAELEKQMKRFFGTE
ncbi:putative multistep phosphorelay regulator [Cercophora samala]|uniref:Multistep phosphorelay regulator n=1 Tax=Cercophora samala TaxID=330535 RepID=A0AA40DEV0_9PEZI|nr:putative multistep phosphorelay regulator [Cercophora samala]